MGFKIQPSNFTLLSQEKQAEFELSWRGKKNPNTARQEVCSYVRNVLPNQDLWKIALELNLDTWLVVLLSNFISNKKELKELVSRYTFLESITENNLWSLLEIIENEFEDFSLDNMSDLSKIWRSRAWEIEGFKKITEVEENSELERAVNERYMKLLKYFSLPHWATWKQALRNHWIKYPSLADEIIEFCEQKWIGWLWYNWWWNNHILWDFLTWYAKRNNLSTRPDSLTGIWLQVGIEF